MLGFSDAAMESMGFQKYDPCFEFKCKAYLLKIYSIEGLDFKDRAIYAAQINENLSFSIGYDAKATVLQLLKGGNVKNIEQIIEENCKLGPHLATLVFNKKEYTLRCNWIGFQEEDHYIVHYALEEAEKDLLECMNAYEIPFIVKVSSIISIDNEGVRLNRLTSLMYGLTPDNKCVDDIRPSFSINIVVGNASSAKHCYERIMEGVRLGMPIKRRVSKLYYLAMRESDSIKKFIFLWTSLEVLINSSFDKIKPLPTIFPDLDEKNPFKERVDKLFLDKSRGRNIKTIAQKYLFLSCFSWSQLNIDDHDLFLECKKVRDNFSHGSEVDLSDLTSNKAAYLINKILASLCDKDLVIENGR